MKGDIPFYLTSEGMSLFFYGKDISYNIVAIIKRLKNLIIRRTCMEQLIKNIDKSKVLNMEALVSYQEGQVVSRTLAQGKNVSLTLFAFDKGEEISSHSSSGDALVYLLDGEAEITIGDMSFHVKKGETIVMPAGVPHALLAKEQFKMLLVVVFQP